MLFYVFSASAQEEQIYAAAKKKTIKNYLKYSPRTIASEEHKILIKFDYGESYIKNSYDLNQLSAGTVKEVNLYYSAFPKGHRFATLNRERIKNLVSSAFELQDSTIAWSIIRQTACYSKAQAEQLFHGFEIILEISEAYKAEKFTIDTTTFDDFVVDNVLKRNEWDEMLIVADLTGSMSPYISQLLLWLKLNTIDQKIKQFVFFNDGDAMADEEKKIGETGGIYETRSLDYKEVENLATKTMLNGYGGDSEENDVEAILKGLEFCEECKENILIADNDSPVRDMELMTQIGKPLRIVLCGVEEKINTQYLDLARATGGSVHLIEEDLTNLVQMNEGEEVEINGMHYMIKDNRFIRFNKT